MTWASQATQKSCVGSASWEKGPYRAMRLNALLQLIGVSPDVVLQ